MKRLSWPVVAMVVLLAAAFCVQATSTWKLGERRHLEGLALPALVVLLEVGSVTSSAIFFSAKTRGVRVRALLMLAVTAVLGGAGGVMAYGWVIGVFVAAALLGLVEVIGAYRHEQPVAAEAKQPIEVDRPTAVDEAGDEHASDPANELIVPATQLIDPATAPIDVETLAWTAVDDAAAARSREPDPWPHLARCSEAARREVVPSYEPDEPRRPDPDDDEPEPPKTGAAERAAEIKAADPSIGEGRLHRQLTAEGYTVTKYQCKKLLGNKIGKSADLEAVS